jgi:hypothetical protein
MLPVDLEEVRAFAKDAQARLVIIDPLVAHLPSSVNSHRDQDVRLALAPLHRLAAELECSIVVIVHTNKSMAGELLHRVSGSVGIVGAARSVAFLAPDPDDPDGSTRVLFHGKNNVGPTASTLRLRVEHREVTGRDGLLIGTSGIAYLGQASDVTREQLLVRHIPERTRPREDAKDWLRQQLAEGAVLVNVLRDEAAKDEIAWRTVQRAKEELGVRAAKTSVRGPWVWRLPEGQDRHLHLVGGLGPSPGPEAEVDDQDRQGEKPGSLDGGSAGMRLPQTSETIASGRLIAPESPDDRTETDLVGCEQSVAIHESQDSVRLKDEDQALRLLKAELGAIERATIDYICMRHREGADFSRITDELNREGFSPPPGKDRWELGAVAEAYGWRHA